MIFNVKNLKQFIYSIKDKNLKQIKLNEKNFEIIINKNIAFYPNNKTHEFKNFNEKKSYNYNFNTQSKQQEKSKPIKIEDESNIYSTIISPMVGTFYRSPAPNEPHFINENDTVQKKQTVCIIEAMKLMNEIESEVKGEIIQILVNDGDIVDCGQSLMKVKITS
uniref:Biotin carboxyl carrier protein of acetyl-CoA carboxylase n=1 Tax=Taenioma perpusillum TaxID=210852 RepID=A0A1Z1MRS1_9FLOR|nr:acetyl-CoA carboxylase biotin carboxyl carrier protein [Taenioma perpusillum]ARW68532.1 acetyl-CoA carboxylase biotin carboxyl carrier protein [Taenioma perpusillum]